MEQEGRMPEDGGELAREEVLRRSRAENRGQDERERSVRVEGESFGLLFLLALGLLLVVWKRARGQSYADVMSMFWISCAANRLYRLTRRRNRSDLVILLLSLAFLVWYLVQFFTEG